MNVLQKYIILYLMALDNKACSQIEIEWALRLIAQVPEFKELRDYIHKLEEPIYP